MRESRVLKYPAVSSSPGCSNPSIIGGKNAPNSGEPRATFGIGSINWLTGSMRNLPNTHWWEVILAAVVAVGWFGYQWLKHYLHQP